MTVYVVVGGCAGDSHIIDVYSTFKSALMKAEIENKACDGLNAYVDSYRVLP